MKKLKKGSQDFYVEVIMALVVSLILIWLVSYSEVLLIFVALISLTKNIYNFVKFNIDDEDIMDY